MKDFKLLGRTYKVKDENLKMFQCLMTEAVKKNSKPLASVLLAILEVEHEDNTKIEGVKAA